MPIAAITDRTSIIAFDPKILTSIRRIQAYLLWYLSFSLITFPHRHISIRLYCLKLGDEVVSLFHDSLRRYNSSTLQLSFYCLILWDEVLSIFEEWCGWRSLFQPMPSIGVTTRSEMIYSNYYCIFIFVDLITVWRMRSPGFLALFKFSMVSYL